MYSSSCNIYFRLLFLHIPPNLDWIDQKESNIVKIMRYLWMHFMNKFLLFNFLVFRWKVTSAINSPQFFQFTMWSIFRNNTVESCIVLALPWYFMIVKDFCFYSYLLIILWHSIVIFALLSFVMYRFYHFCFSFLGTHCLSICTVENSFTSLAESIL